MSRRCESCGQWLPTDEAKHSCPTYISGDKIVYKESGDGALLDARVRRIRTLDDLLEEANVDLDKYYVERHVINKWEVGAKDADGNIVTEPLFQVKVWLRPVEPFAEIVNIITDLKDDLRHYEPPTGARGPQKSVIDAPHCLEVNIADIHFGMLAWHEEAGENWDSKITREIYMDAVSDLKRRGNDAFGCECYLLPIGNDLLHVDTTIDGKGGTTTKGTPQDVDTRFRKMFRNARRMMVDSINMFAEDAFVYVFVVPGNHDRERMFTLGDSIASWFRLDDRVLVNNDAHPRKYFKYGVNLLGFTHGSEEKVKDLPQIMATEASDAWASTWFREWHIGHKHRKTDTIYQPVHEYKGVRIREMPSLAPNDAWHESKGYKHLRSSEALVWNRETGWAGSFAYNIGPSDEF